MSKQELVVENAVPAGETGVVIRKKAIEAKEVLNEAYAYSRPSSFSRGMRLDVNGVTTLLISGTASIDEYGKSVHIGDFRAQLLRTYHNITGLLAAEGATWKDIVRTTCYLRDIERDYAEFNEIRTQFLAEQGLNPLPASTGIQAILCRPELLIRDRSDRHVPDGSQGLEARERARAYPVWSWLSPFRGCARKRKGSMSIAGNVGLKDLPRICPLISRRVQSCLDAGETRIVSVGEVQFGGARPVVIAGPRAVESREQTLEVARAVKIAGADMSAWRRVQAADLASRFSGPRPGRPEDPARSEPRNGLPIVTEVMDPRLVETVAEYADMLQIGSRNMQNYPLLVEAGKSGKPVLLSAEWRPACASGWAPRNMWRRRETSRSCCASAGSRPDPSGEYSRYVLDLSAIPP